MPKALAVVAGIELVGGPDEVSQGIGVGVIADDIHEGLDMIWLKPVIVVQVADVIFGADVGGHSADRPVHDPVFAGCLGQSQNMPVGRVVIRHGVVAPYPVNNDIVGAGIGLLVHALHSLLESRPVGGCRDHGHGGLHETISPYWVVRCWGLSNSGFRRTWA